MIANGGKRIRPVLVLLACESVGGKVDQAIHAAAAAELIHAFTLVHDDIMDSSKMRRGKPTVHIAWDTNTGILAGDVMIGLAMRLLEFSAENSPNGFAVLRAAHSGLIDVCEGQALDLRNADHRDISMDEYFAMIEKKTAKLLEMCVRIGGLLGNASVAELQVLVAFATKLGLAFQMQDDLLDLLGSEAFGKTQGGDIIEGKRTWFMLRLRDRQPSPLVEEFFVNNGLAAEHVPVVVASMHEVGIIDEGRSLIQKFTNHAFNSLNQLPESDARTMLDALAHQLLEREH